MEQSLLPWELQQILWLNSGTNLGWWESLSKDQVWSCAITKELFWTQAYHQAHWRRNTMQSHTIVWEKRCSQSGEGTAHFWERECGWYIDQGCWWPNIQTAPQVSSCSFVRGDESNAYTIMIEEECQNQRSTCILVGKSSGICFALALLPDSAQADC